MKNQLSKQSFATSYALQAKPRKVVPLCPRCGSRTVALNQGLRSAFTNVCLRRCPSPSS